MSLSFFLCCTGVVIATMGLLIMKLSDFIAEKIESRSNLKGLGEERIKKLQDYVDFWEIDVRSVVGAPLFIIGVFLSLGVLIVVGRDVLGLISFVLVSCFSPFLLVGLLVRKKLAEKT
ncbi:MAG: hypothetical protein Q8O71_00355 [bacterium]|nr:hypothetical protein [bacterium]